MDAFLSSILPLALLESLATSPLGILAVPLLITVLTASLVALSLPGAVNTMSFVSGMMLGLGGILVVALGVLVGSHLLFLASRRWLSERLQRRFGARIASVQDHLGKRGPLYVVGARLGGIPHVVVTAGCAATPINARAFLGASLLGMLPCIAISAIAGSTLAAI
ncbi:VTT domain-containing protein [Aurantiacibacter poecillastricola]|uniref:VTT domain-containing protein n=1 Tax=Aurantiacibacter poecillastricola TaxID=3064385 RepID=UPI00273D3769|nr:VTT domain-containing protein [Aurantiacibacter sp. 219JJ12-13]MDP5260160.1 VTT domain-containing protein [Aurantiacibacter sp. 219JJ12-13]